MSEPSPQPYTSRAIKATALLEETRALLRAWHPGETSDALRKRARDEDILGKATRARAVDVVEHAFVRRLMVDGGEPATSLRQLLVRRGNGPWFAQLCLLFAARADVVLREAITVFVRSAAERGLEHVTSAAFGEFLQDQEERGRMRSPWSSSVHIRVARHVLHQLTDLGVLGDSRRGAREILGYRAGPLAVAWLACELHRLGFSDSAIVSHPDWSIWQMRPADVRASLDRSSDLGLWIIQSAGSVVRITWTCKEWREVLAVLEEPSVE